MTDKPETRTRPTIPNEKSHVRAGFRPSEFMRARRPELFSDSQVTDDHQLSREVFEYELDTVTNRKQEIDFENFCRRLAEKELCPNLRPQTGPTGGGDSKVDSETYPVADQISLRWYEGIGRQAASERWAFAISAKKDWEGKVALDVKKIAGTDRGYKLIYFMTNQFVKDKDRAEAEDKLSKKFGTPVHILDRSWIVKCVFENGRLPLAIETLHLSGQSAVRKETHGPHDVERRAELTEVEQQIQDADRYRGVEYQLAEDCLRAALLARGLELPRVEIDGRFKRAEQIANQNGHQQQILRVAYNRAWTAFWWFEDFKELNALYDDAEKLAIASNQASDLELLANLWSLLAGSVHTGHLDAETAKLVPRTERLRTALAGLAADKERPNNALWARTNLLIVNFHETVAGGKEIDALLPEFQAILTAADGLIAYPVEPVARIVRELGNLLPGSSDYDALLESVVSITQRRISEAEAGRVLLERGFQKLRNGKPYDAIRLFGRAQQKLAVRECREELVKALLGCSFAYESVGLLWAGRSNALAAANQAFSEFVEHGVIVFQALACIRKLVCLELRLGRVPYVLQWIDLASGVAYQIGLSDERKSKFLEDRSDQDRILGLLLLKTRFSDLKSVDFLPTLLDRFGLDHSWMALLYALGYEDYLRSENMFPKNESPDDVRDFFLMWNRQPAATDLPDLPELMSDVRLSIQSHVLGCAVTVYVNNNFASLCLGEEVLAALEALLATSLDNGLFPHCEKFAINIESSGDIQGPPEYEFDEIRAESVIVKHNPKNTPIVRSDSSWLRDLVLGIVGRIAVVDDFDAYAKRVFGDENGLNRAFNFSDPLIPIQNILGELPRYRISDWVDYVEGQSFPPLRTHSWDHGSREPDDSKQSRPQHLEPGRGDPPQELQDLSRSRHDDRSVSSLINFALWDRARWRGTLYAHAQKKVEPPLMALGFENAEAARVIFEDWRAILGDVDESDQLRVSIITGINKCRPFSYRVVIGTNPSFSDSDSQPKQFVMISRILEMNPGNSQNLDSFLANFEREKTYFLLPAHLADPVAKSTLFYKLAILKKALHVFPAWKMNENDQDSCALKPEDDPIIPDGIVNPPVIQALEKIRRRRTKPS
jgi:hypothetical protein